MTPVERVERLVRAGAVDREEGQRLLAAIDARPAPSPLGLLVRPFDRLGGGFAALVGLAVSALSVAIARRGVRFDGLIDLHLVVGPVPVRTALLDQLVAWPLAALVFYAYARLVARHVRLVDFLGMTGLARLPLLGAAPLLLALSPSLGSLDPLHPPPALLAGALVSLVFVALDGWLLYQGFKNASGLVGAKLAVGFVALVLSRGARGEARARRSLLILPCPLLRSPGKIAPARSSPMSSPGTSTGSSRTSTRR